jgi:hypothetical protein
VDCDDIDIVLVGSALVFQGGSRASYYTPLTSAADSTRVGSFVVSGAGTYRPDTDNVIADGLPTQVAGALGNLAESNSPPDGVAHTALQPATAILTALAAAGRNPTDITLPTVGAQGGGSGGSSGSGSGSGGGGDTAVVAMGGGGASGSGVLVTRGAVTLPSGSGMSRCIDGARPAKRM